MLLSFSTIEFAPIIGIFVALYAFTILKKREFVNSKRAKKYIFLTAILSIFWLIFALQIKGLFNVSTSPLPSTFHSLWQNPMSLVNTFFADGQTKTMYILVLFAPLAFVPFLAPEYLLMSLPWIASSFLSTYPLYYSIYYQYTGFVIPFLLLALPTAIRRVKFRKAKKIIPALLVVSLIFGYYLPTIQWTPWVFKSPNPTIEHKHSTKFSHRFHPMRQFLLRTTYFLIFQIDQMHTCTFRNLIKASTLFGLHI